MASEIRLINSFSPTVVTSLIEQEKTALTINTNGSGKGTSTVLVSCLVHAPKAFFPMDCHSMTQPTAPGPSPNPGIREEDPMVLADQVLRGDYDFDEEGPADSSSGSSYSSLASFSGIDESSFQESSSASGDPIKKDYTKLIDVKFGNGYRLCVFYANIDKPLDSNTAITVEHPPSKRRVIVVDEFSGVASLDQKIFGTSMNKLIPQIETPPTRATRADSELVYGVVALAGNFKNYEEPADYFKAGKGETSLDQMDASIYTYYKLTTERDVQSLSAFVDGIQTYWAASVTSFFAEDK